MLPQFPSIVSKRDRMNRDAIKRMVQQKAPMLGNIASHIVHEGKATGIARADGEKESTEMRKHSASVEIPRMRINDFQMKHSTFLELIADQFASSQSHQVIEAITTSTEKTGNVVDGGGKPFSDELIYETLEKMAHNFGPNGEWEPPSIILSPEQYEKIIEYDRSRTPEQRMEFDRKLKKLIAKKKLEYDSEQAGRVLVG